MPLFSQDVSNNVKWWIRRKGTARWDTSDISMEVPKKGQKVCHWMDRSSTIGNNEICAELNNDGETMHVTRKLYQERINEGQLTHNHIPGDNWDMNGTWNGKTFHGFGTKASDKSEIEVYMIFN